MGAAAKGNIVAQELAQYWVASIFYQAVVEAVLLYDSKTWCLPATATRPLESFHVKAARRLTDMRLKVFKGE